jgi:hypothetical protein
MKPVLDILKSHTFAIVCAIVAIVGLIAYFVYPIPGMFAELDQDVQARQAVHSSVNGLLGETRTLPNVDVRAAEPEKLSVFPTKRVIDQGNKLVQQLKDETQNTLQVVLKRNERQPLVPNALPNGGTFARQKFLDAYKLATAQVGDGASQGIIQRVLKGSLPPSAEELQQIGDRRASQIIQRELQIGPNNQPINQPQVDAKIQAERVRLPLELRLGRAYSSQIYVSPGAVDVHPGLQGINVPDAITVFNGQLSLWLQTACFEAIAAVNGNSANVFESPIKHLLRLNVPLNFVNAQSGGMAMPTFGGDMGMGMAMDGGDPSAAAIAAPETAELQPDPTATIAPAYSTNPLGYVHNAFYDPIGVQMIIRVEASKAPEILRQLQTGRLLKVKNVQLRSVDPGRAVAEGYVYFSEGYRPLVDLAIDADVLFLRQWLVRYMPPAAKQYFQALATPAVPQG